MATIKEIQTKLNFDEARKSIQELTVEVNALGAKVKDLRKEMQDMDEQLNKMTKKKDEIKNYL